MSGDASKSEMDDYYARTRRPLIRQPTTLAGKIGCGLMLVVWFTLLLSPCTMFWLATGHTIRIPGVNVPEPELHPRLEVRLISEIDNRGLQFVRSRVFRSSQTQLCVQVHVSYLLWVSESADNSVVYCQCYERSSDDAAWEFILSETRVCNP